MNRRIARLAASAAVASRRHARGRLHRGRGDAVRRRLLRRVPGPVGRRPRPEQRRRDRRPRRPAHGDQRDGHCRPPGRARPTSRRRPRRSVRSSASPRSTPPRSPARCGCRRRRSRSAASPPSPVLEPVDALSVDGYSVGGMSVQRVSGDGDKYYMWYAGVPENEFAQRIYLATSTDGTTWTKEPAPVLDLGAAGSFDSRQLTKPSVIYDAANTAAPVPHVVRGRGRDRAAASATRPPSTAAPGRSVGEVPRRPASPAWPTATGSCSRASSSTTACTSCGTRPTTPTTGAWPTRPRPTASTWKRGGVVFDVGGRQLQPGRVRAGRRAHGERLPHALHRQQDRRRRRHPEQAHQRRQQRRPHLERRATSPSTPPAATTASTATTSRSRRSSATRPTPRIRTRCGTSATIPTPTATTTTASASPTRRTPDSLSQWDKVPGPPATRTTNRSSPSGRRARRSTP